MQSLHSGLKFQEHRVATEEVEGWFTDLAIAVSDTMLSHQAQSRVGGGLIEIGAWHGKSAILWMLHASDGEEVVVVDLEVRPELHEAVARVSEDTGCAVRVLKGSSFVVPDAQFQLAHRRRMRLVHIDGDHSAAGIANDLEIAYPLLHTHGVIIVDDFMNPRFPQITEVTMSFISSHPHELALIAVGANKAFIVSAKFFDFWRVLFETELSPAVALSVPSVDIQLGTFLNRPCFGIR